MVKYVYEVFKTNNYLSSEDRSNTKTTTHGRYKDYNERKNHSDARRFCTVNGGHLAEFETKAEFVAFGSFAGGILWTGANDKDKEGREI